MGKLDEDGVIAFHITNRHLGLESVIAGLSQYDYSDDSADILSVFYWE